MPRRSLTEGYNLSAAWGLQLICTQAEKDRSLMVIYNTEEWNKKNIAVSIYCSETKLAARLLRVPAISLRLPCIRSREGRKQTRPGLELPQSLLGRGGGTWATSVEGCVGSQLCGSCSVLVFIIKSNKQRLNCTLEFQSTLQTLINILTHHLSLVPIWRCIKKLQPDWKKKLLF